MGSSERPEVTKINPDSKSESSGHESTAAAKTYKTKIVWEAVVWFTYMHFAAIYGLYLLITQAKSATVYWCVFVGFYTAMGTTAGAHRLWSHKSYKAKLPLRIFLAFCQSSSFQYSIYKWSKDHRLHHKYSETDADPYNPARGIFFSHIGWLLVRKHPDVIAKSKAIDMSDLEGDSVVMWQKKLYPILMPLCTFVMPTTVPWYFWGENFWTSLYIQLFRYMYVKQCAFLVNSVAHRIGTRPYDKSLKPADNIYISILAQGDGWHNYHHVFPWDYRTSEYSGHRLNLTSGFIDFFAKIGWAYDLKTAKPEMIAKRAQRTGDGSHKLAGIGEMDTNMIHNNHQRIEGNVWGLEDKDMKELDKELVETLYPIASE